MKTVPVNVYELHELSAKAQTKAYYSWLESDPYHNDGENKATIKAFERIFPVTVKGWAYGSGRGDRVDWKFIGREALEEMSGLRLATYIWNNFREKLYKGKFYSKSRFENGKPAYKSRRSNIILETSCVLTGYYMDDVILAPVYSFLDRPDPRVTFHHLMHLCFIQWYYACRDDYEEVTKLEAFEEECRETKCFFFENGTYYGQEE